MLHTVAKLHYEAEMSQVDIARQLGVSTATISRLLQRARAEGIVRIEVLDLAAPEEITGQLIDRLGLRDAAVVETPAAGALTALAGPLGGLLKQAQLVAGSVVAIGWGRAVREVIRAGLPRIPGVLTVAATGGMQQHAAHFQVNEFVRLAAEEFGGTPHFIHAPYLPSSELREVFLGDAAISDAVALWDRTDVAIVGIGLPHAINAPEASAATPSEQALVHAAGDVLRHYFDADGALIAWEGEGRMIAMSPAQLRAVPLVIGVAASPEKATAIIGAARARLINAVITDTKTAQAILATLPPR
ncbi:MULTISPECIES: sugar-binding transcriptional regulator [unclassified Mesorhizobium]|uniref:sugar-binding transcriptional regulator n=1 Tax=unclassified Mesorhizobium TaxID=325217 RepID=UPI001128C256|nr:MULTISPECIES: sugar-binding domain-containing protein [unclassified Mesorhizobium]MBZ9699927.1 helix-turn-helix domain-containing protein [Mesorhizobium sp. CO1-1-3]MBZ9946244.1 helix-turn-helix domain-containing protein [Mesorhizobium sp. BR1-1-11]MCA0059694.1 helix-turn-helix domain-containing protein [Mesorhizobium sp. B261B1A]TPJ05508.1 helix-turn-helix domain-containing protein [Mesorhizobium sp. B2-8-1]TPK39634.1 helix-turn-helix domain-containing protein [Mesorhizobium sp. B2-5-3]